MLVRKYHEISAIDLFSLRAGQPCYLDAFNGKKNLDVKFLDKTAGPDPIYSFKILETLRPGESSEIGLLYSNYNKTWRITCPYNKKLYKLIEDEFLFLLDTRDYRVLNYPLQIEELENHKSFILYTFSLNDEDFHQVRKYKINGHCLIAKQGKDWLLCNTLVNYNEFELDSDRRPLILPLESYMISWCLTKINA